MPTKESKTTTTVRLEDEIYNELVRIAKEEVRSINNLIEYALTKFVQEYQEKQRFYTHPSSPSNL